MINPLPCSMMTEKKAKVSLKFFFPPTKKDNNKTIMGLGCNCQKLDLREECKYRRIAQDSFVGIMELFYIKTVVVVTQMYKCVQIHRTVHPPKSELYCMI